jgi:phage replication-related protein YjqB (UPF0714/DUF867 family)
MPDLYDSFAALAASEMEGIHYRIRSARRTSPIVVVAPHGGLIERGTSETAEAIAGEAFSLYLFEGLARRQRGASLHITSTRFDEPRALEMIEASEVAIGVHGRKNRDDDASVWVGGLDEQLRDAISKALGQMGFKAKSVGAGHRLSGRDSANICNRGRRGAGVQLELPLALRLQILADDMLRHEFGATVRQAVAAEFFKADEN